MKSCQSGSTLKTQTDAVCSPEQRESFIVNPAAILMITLALAIGVAARPTKRWIVVIIAAAVICGAADWLVLYLDGGRPARCILLDAPGECVLPFATRWGIDRAIRFSLISFVVIITCSCGFLLFRKIKRWSSMFDR